MYKVMCLVQMIIAALLAVLVYVVYTEGLKVDVKVKQPPVVWSPRL